TGIAGCCARAPSGQAAAAPPMSVMNSRRFIRSPARQSARARNSCRKAYSLWLRCNHRGSRPIFRKNLHDQYAKWQVCLILRGVCEVPGLKIVFARFIDRLLAPLSECKLAGNHISNSGPNVVMDPDVAVRSKREFGGT